jgi:hypothetical protein
VNEVQAMKMTSRASSLSLSVYSFAAAAVCDDILLRGMSFIGLCSVNIKRSWEIYF